MFLRKISSGVLSPSPPPELCQYSIFIKEAGDFHVSQAEPSGGTLSPMLLPGNPARFFFWELEARGSGAWLPSPPRVG